MMKKLFRKKNKPNENNVIVILIFNKYLTSSLISKLGRRPISSPGGIREPLLLDGPEPGANEPFLSPSGLFSRITSIFGVSIPGALISGKLSLVESSFFKKKTEKKG